MSLWKVSRIHAVGPGISDHFCVCFPEAHESILMVHVLIFSRILYHYDWKLLPPKFSRSH